MGELCRGLADFNTSLRRSLICWLALFAWITTVWTLSSPDDENRHMYDCIIVGGGPAGLTAAIYLGRYHLKVLVFDDGRSRAATIPLARNHAGYPNGIRGCELLTRMRLQAQSFGAELISGTVTAITKESASFQVRSAAVDVASRAVLLANGVVNRRPEMPGSMHRAAVADGFVRYCPICDAYEITDKHVAVVGTGDRGISEAVFLRSYTRRVTLVAPGATHQLSDDGRARLTEYGIAVVDGPISKYRVTDAGISLAVPAGILSFAAIYPALGSIVRSELAASLGAQLSVDGCVQVDPHQRTSVPGLFAAGDVVAGLDQISNAMGQGGVAATAIRNDRVRQEPLLRK